MYLDFQHPSLVRSYCYEGQIQVSFPENDVLVGVVCMADIHPSGNAADERKYVSHYLVDTENVENYPCDVRNVDQFDEEVAVHHPLDDEKAEHLV